MDESPPPLRMVMVTGPSGAGRSTAINALEDLGFEAIDNLPMSLIPRLLDGPPLPHPLALGIDARNRDFSSEGLVELIDTLHRMPGVVLEVLYLDAQTDILVRRYSETRRRHPLSPEDTPLRGVGAELELLVPVRARADVLIDTNALTPHDLRAEVARWFAPSSGAALTLSVQSFSYKRGLPRGMDMVFDCRFLSNPYWVPELRAFDGRDPRIAAHVQSDPRFDGFFTRVHDLIASLLEPFVEEGKTSLTIGFGCTGGKHRSVVTTEKLAATLAQQGWQVSKRHRELERQGPDLSAGEQG